LDSRKDKKTSAVKHKPAANYRSRKYKKKLMQAILYHQSSPHFFVERGRDRNWLLVFPIFDISIVPEIFAIECWSCPKSRRIVDDFWPPKS